MAALAVSVFVAGTSQAQSTSDDHGDQGEYDEEMSRGAGASPTDVTAPPAEHANMVRVPGGRFAYGPSEPKGAARETVVQPFLLDRTEVTVGAYRACVAVGTCAVPARTSPYCTFDLGDPALPISCVRHAAAVSFCASRGARLPREAEWELAAKGPSPRAYPWGDTQPLCAVSATLRGEHTAKSCTGGVPARVATHPLGRSPYGIDDLAGNVEEWTADFYAEPRPAAPPRAGASFVLRGGSWLLSPSAAKTTARTAGSSMEAGPGVGFRCAKDA